MIKILIGGVPYGTENIGDEAILAGIVTQLRKLRDGLDISVITADPDGTGRKLGITGVELKFDPESGRPMWTEAVMRAYREADVFVHGGATGLHDYPMHLLKGFRVARETGTRAVLLGTGGGVYNHKFWPGRKTKLLALAKKCAFGLVDFRKILEARETLKYRRAIREGLERDADLIMVRDENTKQVLVSYGLDVGRVHVCGDAAYAMEPSGRDAVGSLAERNNLWKDDAPVVGVCISSQRKVADMGAVVRLCDTIIEKYGAHVLFVPMNPFTDDKIGDEIAAAMKQGDETRMLRGYVEPEYLLAFLGGLRAIVSSRLHLIILGSLAGVPAVGIGRGSRKVATFLARFGLEQAGEYDDVNYEGLAARFDEVWHRRDELSAIIKADMDAARAAFGRACKKMLPIFDSIEK